MKTVKTDGSEYFYSIPGLVIPRNEVSETLSTDIDYVGEWVQKNADGLMYLMEYHIEAFIYEMKMLHKMLSGIYARWLENDASKIIKVAETSKEDIFKKLVPPFVSKAHMLAIEIQMAQKEKPKKVVEVSEEKPDNNRRYNEIGRCEDVLNSLSIITDILDSGNPDFRRIIDIAVSSDELKFDENAISFFSAVALENEERVRDETEKLSSIYYSKINGISSTAAKAAEPKTILIVDDMADILTTLTLMLEEFFRIYALSDGYEVLEMLDSGKRPDAFLLDIDMPAMDGFTLAEKIREREEHTNTPILFLTSKSAKEIVLQACVYNPSAFIVKPANRDIIIAKLSECVVV